MDFNIIDLNLRKERKIISWRLLDGGGVMVWYAICNDGAVTTVFGEESINAT